MRILMIAPEPFFRPRGTPFSVYHRLKAMSELGHQIDLVTYPFGQDVVLPNVRIIRSPRPPGIRDVPIGPSVQKIVLDVGLVWTVFRLLRRHRYELIHTHEEAALIGAYWSRRRGIPHLYDMHSLLSQQMRNFRVPLARWAETVWRRLERWAMQRSDAIIAICPELANAVRRIVPDRPCTVIENVGIAEFVLRVQDVEVQALRRRINPSGDFLIGYVGTFEPYQGIDLLMETIAVVQSRSDGMRLRWILAGVTPQERPGWDDRIRRLPHPDRVHLFDRMPPERAAVLQKAVHLLVSPRISGTNTPLKIYSYLASGTPILATRHPTHLQVLNDRIAILVEPFVEGVIYAMTHPDDLRMRAERAFRYFAQHYSYAAFLDKTRRVLAQFATECVRA